MFSSLKKRKLLLLPFLDVLAVIISYLSTYFFIGNFNVKHYFLNVGVAIIIYVIFLIVFRVYKQIVRFSSVREYSICMLSSLTSCLCITLISLLVNSQFIEVKQHLLAGGITSIEFVVIRVIIRNIIADSKRKILSRQPEPKKKRTLIIGGGYAGCLVLKEIMKNHSDNYDLIGIIDDDEGKKGCTIQGIKILGDRNKIQVISAEKNIDLILFCISQIDGEEKKNILDLCYKTGKSVKVLPGVNELIFGKSMFRNLKDIDVTDLMPRETIKLDDSAIKDYISDKVVLVTGGGGSIGSELCRQIAKFSPRHLIILDIYENNAYDLEYELNTLYKDLNKSIVIASVRDRERLEEIFDKYKPQIVFHAAAHKHVPLMESNAVEAIKNNVFGTMNVAECSDKFGAERFILISTDKAVNPTNIMGATKRICEMIIQGINEKSKTDYVAVRFGNVLGSNGSVIPLFKKQIANGGPITVTHREITRFFMTIPEAAQLVLQAGTYAAGGEIFVLDMGKPVKIYDLAESMIRLSGLVPGKDIEIRISGLRPGEKLYEELLMSEEGLTNTQNKKIFIARPMHIDYNELKGKLTKLLEVAKEEKNDSQKLKKELKEVVPTYKSADN